MSFLANIFASEPTVLLAVAAGAVLLVVDLATSPRSASKAPSENSDRG